MGDVTKKRDDLPTTKPDEQIDDVGSRVKQQLMKGMLGLQPVVRPETATPRLIFALDATGSRRPTWDMACQLQAEMFRAVPTGLEVQLVYYRGPDECRASRWVSSGEHLADLMSRIDCRNGQTQIGRILAHAHREAEKAKIKAMVFIGDAMEEKIDELAAAAAALRFLGVPMFMFQEGNDYNVAQAYQEIAHLTRGAYCRFDAGAAHQLAELLGAVAAYAAGGIEALSGRQDTATVKLLEQLK
jgi:hypothetical protein